MFMKRSRKYRGIQKAQMIPTRRTYVAMVNTNPKHQLQHKEHPVHGSDEYLVWRNPTQPSTARDYSQSSSLSSLFLVSLGLFGAWLVLPEVAPTTS